MPENFKINIKLLVFVLIIVFYGSLITYKITLPAAEDLPRQMQNGRDILHGNFEVLTENVYSYTEPEHRFANHHWFYGVLAYGLHSVLGFQGIVIFKVIILLFTFSLLFYIATRKANFWLVALFSIPTILVLVGRSSARPEIFSYFFIVLFLYLLTNFENNPKSNKVFYILPLQILWANIHIMFPFGVALVGSYWVSTIAKDWRGAIKNEIVRKITLLLVLTALVSFLNPLGIGGVIYSLKANMIDGSQVFSAEMQSIADVFKVEPKSWHIGAVIFTPMLVLLMASFILAYKKRPIFYFLMSIGSAILSFKVIRGLPVFALVFLPAVTENLDTICRRFFSILKTRWFQIYKLVTLVAPLLFIVLLLYGMFFWRHKIIPYKIFGVGITDTFNNPADFFKENGLKGPILNDTSIGGYLIFNLFPEERVFADNRFRDAYSSEFLENDYVGLYNNEEKWQEMLKKYEFNTIILNHNIQNNGITGFISRRIYDPQWVWVYAGRSIVIFVQNVSENEKIIQNYAITPNNIEKKLSHLSNASDYRGQIAAADLFGFAGNAKLAILGYEKVVKEWPYMGKVWFAIGRNVLTRADQENSDTVLSLSALEHAISVGYKTPEAYSYLALAYYRLGEIDKAREAVKEELEIDPENKDGQSWLDLLETKNK